MIQWHHQGNEMNSAGSNAAAYSDFKNVIEQTGFRGDLFYIDRDGAFYIRSVDYVRGIIHTVDLNASSGSQKPATFDADFPSAIAVGADGAIFSIST